MRHGNKNNHLGRTHSHKEALMKNMSIALVKHKRIESTLAKAKELRKYIEPLITKAKNDTTHSRRTVFSYLQDKESIKILFDEIANKVAERNGGYTRIIKLGFRRGDNAEVALIELVDYNEALMTSTEEKTTKTRRSRRGGGKKAGEGEGSATNEAGTSAVVVDDAAVTYAEVVEDTPVAEAVVAATEEVVETAEVVSTEVEAAAEGEAPKEA